MNSFVKCRNFFSSVQSYSKHLAPEYELLSKSRIEEPVNIKRSRLMYQSKKRGTLENCLLLGTFAVDHLGNMDSRLLGQYDELINLPTEWELYYWIMGTRTIPNRFDNEVMALLKQHVKRNEKTLRTSQPDQLNS